MRTKITVTSEEHVGEVARSISITFSEDSTWADLEGRFEELLSLMKRVAETPSGDQAHEG